MPGAEAVILRSMLKLQPCMNFERSWCFQWSVRLVVLGCLFLGLTAMDALAQSQTNETKAALANSTKSKGKSKPTISERPQVIGAVDTSSTASKPERPKTAVTGEAAKTAELVEKFQAARNDYLKAEQELGIKSKTATDEQRALLREKAGEALVKWREQQRAFMEEQQERVKTIKQELQADLGQRVDSTGEGGTGGRGR